MFLKFLKELRDGPSAAVLLVQQREEAARELVKHEATLEHVTAIRDMYKTRLERLNSTNTQPC